MLLSMIVVCLSAYLILVSVLRYKRYRSKSNSVKLAFFHPFCNDCGGGQKVLWCIIHALLEQNQNQSSQLYQKSPQIAIYSLEPSFELIAEKVKNRFNIELKEFEKQIKIVHISGRSLLIPRSRLTMVCQILLPMFYCLKCVLAYQPDLFYDTTGFAYNFLLVKLLFPWPSKRLECRAYVHYPFISTDMISKVERRRSDFNNDSEISSSKWRTKVKVIYYRAILWSYRLVGYFVDEVQVNSTWTYQHMADLWGGKTWVSKLYPPCSIDGLLECHKDYSEANNIISLAQFRPEKNHMLQIEVLNKLVEMLKRQGKQGTEIPHLYICGSTRGQEDEQLLEHLKCRVQQLKVSNHVTFCVNLKFTDLMTVFKSAQLGIHTMEAEHFGISVVQMLAAGCLVMAHNSAGPRFDIIRDPRFLAVSEDEYLQKLYDVVIQTPDWKSKMAAQFREAMKGFGEHSFRQNFRQMYHKAAVKSTRTPKNE